LKREDMQPVFSFKCRGAYNKMANLSAAALARGVIASSAGNHAQGVALAAQKLGCAAVIVMPSTTPKIKVDAVKARGAEVHLHGDTYDEAHVEAKRLAKARKLGFVHPYEDPDVIAGQGTIGMEILRQTAHPIHAVFVPIGGGGLVSGIASYIKRLRPAIKVVGVEPVDADAMARSLKAGRRVVLEHVGLFADGVAVKQVGEETFRLCKELLDGVILVDTDQICAAIKDVFEDTRTIAVASGANTNFDRLRFVAERAEVGDRRETILAVTIAERPGSFKKFCATLGARNITEFNYRIADPKDAHVFVGVEVHSRDESAKIVKVLERKGLKTLDLSDD
jgi:threonine dehydratase